MKRIEVIANRTVEEDILEEFSKRGVGKRYTKIPFVQGMGRQGPRKGDGVWPEENFILILYCGEHEAEGIRSAVFEVKRRFQSEGIKLFEIG